MAFLGKFGSVIRAAGQADQVGELSQTQDLVGQQRIVDAVAGHYRDPHLLFDPLGEIHEAPSGKGHHGELGHPGLVPAAGDVHGVGPGRLQDPGKGLPPRLGVTRRA